MAAAAIPLAASVLGPMLSGLFGGNPGKKTRKLLRKFLERMMPLIEGESRQRFTDYRDLYGTSVPFLKGLVPTKFDQLSPYGQAYRDRALTSFLSGQEGVRVGGMGQLQQKFGHRAPAGAMASFLGQLARGESAGRTDISRDATLENTRMGLVGSEGLRAWAQQGEPLQSVAPFANLAAGTGLQSQGGFGGNFDIGQLLQLAGKAGGDFLGQQQAKKKDFNSLLGFQRTYNQPLPSWLSLGTF